jgi:hypothetical protein
MAGPVYKLWAFKYSDAWHQLSEEEQEDFAAKLKEAYEEVGGKLIIACDAAWSAEQWTAFGVDEFPDIEAVQKFTDLLKEHDHFRYIDSMSVLGTKWDF